MSPSPFTCRDTAIQMLLDGDFFGMSEDAERAVDVVLSLVALELRLRDRHEREKPPYDRLREGGD